MKKSMTKKDFWIMLGIVLAILIAFVITFSLLYNSDKNNDEDIKKPISVSEIPSNWEYFAPALEFNKKTGKDFAWSQIGFMQVSLHIEVGSQIITPKLKYVDGLGETKISDYSRDTNILAVVDYLDTPYGGYNIESMECDTYSSGVIYSTQSIKEITSDSFNIVIEKISIIYVDGTKEISKNYTGSQILENFDFKIGIIGYDVFNGGKYDDDRVSEVIFEIEDVEVSFYDYGIYISWKLTSNCKGTFDGIEVRFSDNTKAEQWDDYDFSISDNNIMGIAIRGDFSSENLPIEIKFMAILTNGSLVFPQNVVVADFEIVNNT